MALILSLESSSEKGSISLALNGMVLFALKDEQIDNHAIALGEMAKKCFEYIDNHELKLDAIAVSMGPGSYTGLRIGLSMAKGICFGLNIPLIGISTLKIMAAMAMFDDGDWEGDEVIVPMIDARRNEVYTACFDSQLNYKVEEIPIILNEDTFIELNHYRKTLFIGNGISKFKEKCKLNNVKWMSSDMPDARVMAPLAEKSYRENNFIDIAYSVPNYLKEYQVTTPKNKIIKIKNEI